MQLSYWEIKTWFKNVDFTVIGSGIVGLSCAIQLKQKFPNSKIVVLEKGIFPSGASTKNAGFACFGSPSEILDDLTKHSEEEVFKLVKKRIEGLNALRKNLGNKNMSYKNNGGFEIFRKQDIESYEFCLDHLKRLNNFLYPLFNDNAFIIKQTQYGFKSTLKHSFFTPFEGQIDTGMMMTTLIKKAVKMNILIINGTELTGFTEQINHVNLKINTHLEFKTQKLLFATNGFANQLLNLDVKPARAQVVITKPIKNLKICGNFHLDKGYNYFRNIDNRILLGGGRNLDFKQEETTSIETTEKIQLYLENLLKEMILPGKTIEIESRWSGIMGVGNQKEPILKQISNNVYCGVRLGGMGVAIGTILGKELAELTYS